MNHIILNTLLVFVMLLSQEQYQSFAFTASSSSSSSSSAAAASPLHTLPFISSTTTTIKLSPKRKIATTTQLQQETSSSSDTATAAPIEEIDRRRNLAIISHPDSGKTTMTEKLLLYGGALQQAGAVRLKGEQRSTQSDFMEMERERGISISSTVMNFDYEGYRMNILDTPGHQDFSEDTYRALAAADNAIMLLDAAKGLEPQTRKLFEVCRLRGLPLFTFCNKMDRPALSPYELMDQIQEEFQLESFPVLWPIGTPFSFVLLLLCSSMYTVHIQTHNKCTTKILSTSLFLSLFLSLHIY